MKNLLILSILILALVSCNNKPLTEADLLGKWVLTDLLFDPGDGSGHFQGVESDKTLEFKADGTVICMGNICEAERLSNGESFGTFDFDEKLIYPSTCDSLTMLIEKKYILVTYHCPELCSGKFTRM